MQQPKLDGDTLQAIMRLVLRLTRSPQLAFLFDSLGGLRHLLAVRASSGFTGFTATATLIIRHIVDAQPGVLHAATQRAVRHISAGVASPTSLGVSVSSPGCREVHYVLRLLGPTACRWFHDTVDEVRKQVSLYTEKDDQSNDKKPIYPITLNNDQNVSVAIWVNLY